MIESIKDEKVVMMRSELNQRLRAARLEQLLDVDRLLSLNDLDKPSVQKAVRNKIHTLQRQLRRPIDNVKTEG